MSGHHVKDLISCYRYYSRMPGGMMIIELVFPLSDSIKEFYYLTPSGFLVTDTQLKVDSNAVKYKGECYYRIVPLPGLVKFCDAYITIDTIERYIKEYVESQFVYDTRRIIIEEVLVAAQRVILLYSL